MVDVVPNRSLQQFTSDVADQLRNPNISGKEAAKQSARMGAACVANFVVHSAMALSFLVGSCTLKVSEIACAFFGLRYDLNSSPASRDYTLSQTVAQMDKAVGSLVILAMLLSGPFKPQWVAKVSDRFGFSMPKETYFSKGQHLLSEGLQFVRKHPRATALSFAALGVAFDLYKTGYLAAGASAAWSRMPYITWDKPGELPTCPVSQSNFQKISEDLTRCQVGADQLREDLNKSTAALGQANSDLTQCQMGADKLSEELGEPTVQTCSSTEPGCDDVRTALKKCEEGRRLDVSHLMGKCKVWG